MITNSFVLRLSMAKEMVVDVPRRRFRSPLHMAMSNDRFSQLHTQEEKNGFEGAKGNLIFHHILIPADRGLNRGDATGAEERCPLRLVGRGSGR